MGSLSRLDGTDTYFHGSRHYRDRNYLKFLSQKLVYRQWMKQLGLKSLDEFLEMTGYMIPHLTNPRRRARRGGRWSKFSFIDSSPEENSNNEQDDAEANSPQKSLESDEGNTSEKDVDDFDSKSTISLLSSSPDNKMTSQDDPDEEDMMDDVLVISVDNMDTLPSPSSS